MRRQMQTAEDRTDRDRDQDRDRDTNRRPEARDTDRDNLDDDRRQPVTRWGGLLTLETR